MRFSQVYYPGCLNILFCQAHSFENICHCGYSEQNIHLKDRGGCEEPPVAWVQIMGQAAVMSYGRPSPMCLITGSYNLIDTPRGQQGLPLAGRWLVWRLSGCSRGRYTIATEVNARKPHMKISSVQFSCSVVSDSLRPHEPQHVKPPCPSPTPGIYPNSCPLSQ